MALSKAATAAVEVTEVYWARASAAIYNVSLANEPAIAASEAAWAPL